MNDTFERQLCSEIKALNKLQGENYKEDIEYYKNILLRRSECPKRNIRDKHESIPYGLPTGIEEVTEDRGSLNDAQTLKVVFIGDSGVGKTSLIHVLCNEVMKDEKSTIGVDFKAKTYKFTDKYYKINIWDTAGQERYRSIATSYLRGCHGAIVVYDITDKVSFLNASAWIDTVKTFMPNGVAIAVLGNKTDAHKDRKVSVDMGRGKFTQHPEVMFFDEVTALESDRFKVVFAQIVKLIIGKVDFATLNDEINGPASIDMTRPRDGGNRYTQESEVRPCCGGS